MKVGIDQSFTSTGVVLVDDNNQMVDFAVFNSTTSNDIHLRGREIVDQVIGFIRKHDKIDSVRIEGLAFGGFGNATRNLSGLQWILIDNIIHVENIISHEQLHIINPRRLKVFATGSGKAEKINMIESLPNEVLDKFAKSGYKLKTNKHGKTIASKGLNDLADAYWLATFELP